MGKSQIMSIKKGIFETILAFPIVFGMFHFFIFSLWLYWPLAPEIPIILSSSILLACYKRMEWFVPYPLHNRNQKSPRFLHKIIELPVWYAVMILLYQHLGNKFNLESQLKDDLYKILAWGYGAFFLISLTVSPISYFVLNRFSRLISKVKEIPLLIERVLTIFSVYIGVAAIFSALFRYLSLWEENSFNIPIENALDAFYFSIVTMTTLGYGEIHPASSTAKVFVIIEVLIGIVLLAVMVGTAISATFHEVSINQEKHNNSSNSDAESSAGS